MALDGSKGGSRETEKAGKNDQSAAIPPTIPKYLERGFCWPATNGMDSGERDCPSLVPR